MNKDTRLLRILLVDDELPIRQRLRLFDWAACGCEIAGEAGNGEEALDLCSRYNPDLIFADIRMPVMSGLDLLQCVSRDFPHTLVIILTSYNDFDYARQALRLGAADYLVKLTLSQEELEQAVAKARKQIRQLHSFKEHQQEEERQRRSQLFRQILGHSPEQAGPLLQELLAPYPLPELPFRFVRLMMQVNRDDGLTAHHELKTVLASLEKQCSVHETPAWLWFPLNTGDYLLIFLRPAAADELELTVKQLVSTLRSSVSRQLPHLRNEHTVYGILSSTVSEYSGLHQAFRETFLWIYDLFYHHTELLFSGKPEPMQPLMETLSLELRSGFHRFMNHMPEVQEEFVSWLTSQRIYPNDVKAFMKAELRGLGLGSGGRAAELFNRIEDATSIDELIGSIIYLFHSDARKIVRPEIRKAKELIELSLGEPLTLPVIADEVGLSSDYFGRLFHEQTGETFKEYVTRMRIEKAISLLQTTNMKVYSVSEAVGFPSYRYFAPLFRKMTGMSPSEYKRGGSV